MHTLHAVCKLNIEPELQYIFEIFFPTLYAPSVAQDMIVWLEVFTDKAVTRKVYEHCLVKLNDTNIKMAEKAMIA